MMNLLAGLFMAQLLYVIGVGGVQDADLCSALSLSLQYVRMAVLCWLTASAHHMHASFRGSPSSGAREGLSASFVRYSLFGWGVPLLCLAVSASLQAAHGDDGVPTAPQHPQHTRRMRFRRPHEHMVEQLLQHEALVLGTKVDHLPRRHNSTSILGSSSTFLSEDVGATEGDCWFPEGGTWAFGLGFLVPAIVLLTVDAFLLVKCAILVRSHHSLLTLDCKASEKIRANRRLQVCLFARLSILIGIITALGAAARLSTDRDQQHNLLPHPSTTSNSTVNVLAPSTVVPHAKDTVSDSKNDELHEARITRHHGQKVPGSNALWLAFDVANALQGIIVALFVTCDCGVLRLYTRSLRRGGSKKRKKRKDSLRSCGAVSRGKTSGRPPWRPGMSNSASLQMLTLDPAPDTV